MTPSRIQQKKAQSHARIAQPLFEDWVQNEDAGQRGTRNNQALYEQHSMLRDRAAPLRLPTPKKMSSAVPRPG